MATPKWKDVSSFSQSDKVRTPNSFEVQGISLRLIVHRMHQCEGWFMSCYDLSMTGRQLKATTVPEAQDEAVALVFARVKKMLEEVVSIPSNVGKKKT